MRFVYILVKPGSDVDGEDTIIRAETREEADILAEIRKEKWNCKALRFIGRREGDQYIFEVPVAELPEWAQDLVAQRSPSVKRAS